MADAKSILIIDDDETLCTALEAKFGSMGYTVTISKDGADGIEALQNTKFDVVITDLHMPNMNGFSVLEKVPDTQNADVPVYVITNLGSGQHCSNSKDDTT